MYLAYDVHVQSILSATVAVDNEVSDVWQRRSLEFMNFLSSDLSPVFLDI